MGSPREQHAKGPCFPWGTHAQPACSPLFSTMPQLQVSSSLLPPPAFRGWDQGLLKTSAPVCCVMGKDKVGSRHSQVGDTATDGESPAPVPWGDSPGPCSWETSCHWYLSHRTETEMSMTKLAQSRDKGLSRGPRGLRASIVPAAHHVTSPKEVRKHKGGKGMPSLA